MESNGLKGDRWYTVTLEMIGETTNWIIGIFSKENFKVRQENKKFPDLELSLRELKKRHIQTS